VINVCTLLVSTSKEPKDFLLFFLQNFIYLRNFCFFFCFFFSSLFIIKHHDVHKDVVVFLSYYDYDVFSKVFLLELDLLNHSSYHLLISDQFFLYNSLDHVDLCYQNVLQSKKESHLKKQ
jgi:hypothetical protein